MHKLNSTRANEWMKILRNKWVRFVATIYIIIYEIIYDGKDKLAFDY